MYTSSSPPTPTFHMAVSPVKGPADPGSTKSVTVWNQGKVPLQVTMSAREVVRDTQGHCVAASHEASWATIGPTHFTLKPGQHRATVLHINQTGATAGQHDLTAFATTPTGTVRQGTSTVHTNAALGSQFLVRMPGTVAANAPQPCVSLAQAPAAGFPTLLIAEAGVALWIVVLVVWALLLRRSHARQARAS